MTATDMYLAILEDSFPKWLNARGKERLGWVGTTVQQLQEARQQQVAWGRVPPELPKDLSKVS